MVENVSPREAFDALMGDKQAQLVDVRSDAELTVFGAPDLSAAGKSVVAIPWQLNEGFVGAMRHAGALPDHKLYFICRAGGRSLAAAQAMERAGYPQVYNVAGGFEGPHDGGVSGWKADGLPWKQR